MTSLNPETTNSTPDPTGAEAIAPLADFRISALGSPSPDKPFNQISSRAELQDLSPRQFDELKKIVADVARRSLYYLDEDRLGSVVGAVYIRLLKWYDPAKAPEGQIVPITAKWARQECNLLINRRREFDELPKEIPTSDTTLDSISLIEEQQDYLRQLSIFREAVQLLDPKKREILEMAMDGVSYAEIGEKFSMPRSHVRVAVFRARKELSSLIRAQGGNLAED